jgi:hypothetical protein
MRTHIYIDLRIAHCASVTPARTAHAVARMPALIMSERQRQELTERGFVVLESFLAGAELARVTAGVHAFADRLRSEQQLPGGAGVGQRACELRDATCMELMDHAGVLPYIVDAIGCSQPRSAGR